MHPKSSPVVYKDRKLVTLGGGARTSSAAAVRYPAHAPEPYPRLQSRPLPTRTPALRPPTLRPYPGSTLFRNQ